MEQNFIPLLGYFQCKITLLVNSPCFPSLQFKFHVFPVPWQPCCTTFSKQHHFLTVIYLNDTATFAFHNTGPFGPELNLQHWAVAMPKIRHNVLFKLYEKDDTIMSLQRDWIYLTKLSRVCCSLINI